MESWISMTVSGIGNYKNNSTIPSISQLKQFHNSINQEFIKKKRALIPGITGQDGAYLSD